MQLGNTILLALTASVAASMAVACGSDDPQRARKGMFELVADDFSRHDTFGLGTALSSVAPFALDGAWQDTGIAFTKGDLLLIEGSGTIQAQTLPGGESVTVGPEGQFGWLGGYIYVLPNRSLLALYGRIGSSVFRIGSGSALLAPDSGNLEVVINYCDGCDVQGAFDVAIHTELSAGVELADQPTLTDNSIVETIDLDVAPSGSDWSDTGMTVKRGEKVFVTATGEITVDGLLSGNYNANGNEPYLGGVPYLIPSTTAYRLFARVGSSIVRLGTNAVFLAPGDGKLELGINASKDDALSGVLNVEIERGVRPARGLAALDADALGNVRESSLTGDDGFKSTGLTVERGWPIVVSGTGTLSGSRIDGLGEAGASVTPFGASAMGGTIFLLPSRPAYAVHARVADQVFYVGGSNVVLAPTSGSLELAPNGIRCNECTDCSTCTPPGCDEITCVDCNQWCKAIIGSFEMTVSTPAESP